jgi:hypothetical protein
MLLLHYSKVGFSYEVLRVFALYGDILKAANYLMDKNRIGRIDIAESKFETFVLDKNFTADLYQSVFDQIDTIGNMNAFIDKVKNVSSDKLQWSTQFNVLGDICSVGVDVYDVTTS